MTDALIVLQSIVSARHVRGGKLFLILQSSAVLGMPDCYTYEARIRDETALQVWQLTAEYLRRHLREPFIKHYLGNRDARESQVYTMFRIITP